MSDLRPDNLAQLEDGTSQDQRAVRLGKRARMLRDGVDPYPPSVPRTHTLGALREQWADLPAGTETNESVSVAGRVVHIRDTGRLVFAALQDDLGVRLQLMLNQKVLGDAPLEDWKSRVDLGDHVSATGFVVTSRRGELSVLASEWAIASKAIRPLPALHHELSAESRAAARYMDLLVSERTRELTVARAKSMRAIRRVLDQEGFFETDTPVLQHVHGGAKARPFRTHFNSLNADMCLRIALELNLKKAMVGGMGKVYELGRVFRNEGLDSTHSPEFTMLEAYESYGDQYSAAKLARTIILATAEELGISHVQTRNGQVPLFGEWPWVTVHDAISKAAGREVTHETPLEIYWEIANDHGLETSGWSTVDDAVLALLDELVEPNIDEPTFLADYPASAQPLARPHREKHGLVEAWDLIVGGVERATGFTELIDPVHQRHILEAQSRLAAAGNPEAMEIDEGFLRALEHGAPPMGGIGIGLERLLMMFYGVGIRDTQLFPHVRPQGEGT